jgi:hypothetical protein
MDIFSIQQLLFAHTLQEFCGIFKWVFFKENQISPFPNTNATRIFKFSQE